ncbi:uncharacterized protein LOC125500586 [Athalia rosae]|uniref:uncharacterized protein LOC125500586 n=1 Tax=Athalia rosae TaxID=37344 RepID=UPI0020338E0C|nr:uncharacterized protein LOC125500586 [Athalia rosae]
MIASNDLTRLNVPADPKFVQPLFDINATKYRATIEETPRVTLYHRLREKHVNECYPARGKTSRVTSDRDERNYRLGVQDKTASAKACPLSAGSRAKRLGTTPTSPGTGTFFLLLYTATRRRLHLRVVYYGQRERRDQPATARGTRRCTRCADRCGASIKRGDDKRGAFHTNEYTYFLCFVFCERPARGSKDLWMWTLNRYGRENPGNLGEGRCRHPFVY